MKQKLYFLVKKHMSGENLRILLLLIFGAIIIVKNINIKEFSYADLIDSSIVLSFMLLSLCDVLAKAIRQFIEQRCEDNAKLTTNYTELIKKYENSTYELFEYMDSCTSESISEPIKFPVILLGINDGSYKLEIQDNSEKYYTLPKQICDLSDDIMEAHGASILYNQMHIRCVDIQFDETNKTIYLRTERTYYYDSMVTNRACDYKLKNGKSVREIYEPGPILKSLSTTKMSNHLGYNGFIVTTDNMIPFIMRKRNLSIGKNTLATSIGASMKVRHAVNESYQFTREGLVNTIKNEIHDELGIDVTMIDDGEILKSIFAFYRDLVECGKPQFLFYLKVPYTAYELDEIFRHKQREKKKRIVDKVLQDGDEIYFVGKNNLKVDIINMKPAKITIKVKTKEKNITNYIGEDNLKVDTTYIQTEKITTKWKEKIKTFAIMPSASASIAMLVKHLNVND